MEGLAAEKRVAERTLGGNLKDREPGGAFRAVQSGPGDRATKSICGKEGVVAQAQVPRMGKGEALPEDGLPPAVEPHPHPANLARPDLPRCGAATSRPAGRVPLALPEQQASTAEDPGNRAISGSVPALSRKVIPDGPLAESAQWVMPPPAMAQRHIPSLQAVERRG